MKNLTNRTQAFIGFALVAVVVAGLWGFCVRYAEAQTVELDGASRWSQLDSGDWAAKVVVHTTDQASTITTDTSGAIDVDWAPGAKVRIHEIRVTLNANGGSSEDLDIVLDSGNGSAYDHRYSSTDMNANDMVRVTEDIIMNHEDDVLKIDYANGNNKTYGVEIIYQPL